MARNGVFLIGYPLPFLLVPIMNTRLFDENPAFQGICGWVGQCSLARAYGGEKHIGEIRSHKK